MKQTAEMIGNMYPQQIPCVLASLVLPDIASLSCFILEENLICRFPPTQLGVKWVKVTRRGERTVLDRPVMLK